MVVIPAVDLVRRWRTEFDIDAAACFRGVDAVRVLECEDSGLICFDPPVIGDESLYRALERHDWYYLEDKWEHRLSLRSVRPGARVLEVGCGRGAFLVKAKERGAFVSGVELNNAAAEIAAQRGIDIVNLDIHQAPKDWVGSFDLVTSFQVVEHVPEPFLFCQKLFSFVKPGGSLHVAVPNRDSFIRHSETILDLPPHHASRWNARSLTYLGGRIGAGHTRIVRGPLEPIHIDWFLSIYRQKLGRLALNRISMPVARALLRAGARHLFMGHSIVGIYQK